MAYVPWKKAGERTPAHNIIAQHPFLARTVKSTAVISSWLQLLTHVTRTEPNLGTIVCDKFHLSFERLGQLVVLHDITILKPFP